MSLLLHLADRVINRPLLIMPDKAAVIAAVLGGRLGLDAAALSGPAASRFVGAPATETVGDKTARKPFMRTEAGVGIVTVTGSLVNRGAWIGAASGLTSYEGIKAQLAAAAEDGATRAILLDLHSPGGEAIGCFEAADAIREAAARKPVVAVVNGMAASAAYAMASAATRIVTTRTGVSGSIGVVLMHADYSRSLDRQGITPTLIFAGDHKVDGNPFEPLPDDVKASLKAEVDNLYDLFVETVAQGRKGLDADAVRGTQARTFIGQAAVDAGLADAVGSFETALAGLSAGPPRARPRDPAMRSKGSASMTDITLDQHNDALAAARETASAEGARLAQARIAAILGHEEAKDRVALARHLAFETRQSLEDAVAVLKVTPKEPSAEAGDLARLEARGQAASTVLAALKDAAGIGATTPEPAKTRIDAAAIYAARKAATA